MTLEEIKTSEILDKEAFEYLKQMDEEVKFFMVSMCGYLIKKISEGNFKVI